MTGGEVEAGRPAHDRRMLVVLKPQWHRVHATQMPPERKHRGQAVARVTGTERA
jgi:hypothetical protein